MTAKRVGLTVEEQEKYFNDACENVRKNAFYMQQQLDNENLHDALRYASTMINELRTSKLYPTRYYEVYMSVTNQLTHLENYIDSEYRKKSSVDKNNANTWLKDLYDRVQYCGNIVPRLYLLITVGSICVRISKSDHEEVMKILFDLVQLTKGVQHPTRGLFLRNYLSQITRLVLPDVPENVTAENIEDHPIVKKSADFVLQNFAEMTRLWVRMQHQGAVRDRTRRERERLQLRMLVGTNLRRLSELNVVSSEVYQQYILKRITDQIVKCKDRIAQEYLMECLIMVFSDEYHLKTLEEFLSTVNRLVISVNVNQIIIKLMERLSRFAVDKENIQLFEIKDVFEIFQEYCKKIMSNHQKMSLDDILSLQFELINFATHCYPGRHRYIAIMMDETLAIVSKHCGEEQKIPKSCVSHLHRMMVAPISAMNMRLLDIESYLQLIHYMPTVDDVRLLACDIIEGLTAVVGVEIESPEQIEKLFGMIEPLLFDEDDNTLVGDGNDDAFEDEQNMISKLIHLICNTDTDVHYKTLHLARKYFGKGGERRLLFTFPPLVWNCLKLIQKTNNKLQEENESQMVEVNVKPKKMFQFVHQVCTAYGGHEPEFGVRMWLQGGLAADQIGFTGICYEFLSQAFLCFEEHISDSKEQYESIRCIASALQRIYNLEEEAFDTLRSKCVAHSNRLLKKPSSAQCFILCSHLYIDTKYRDEKNALKCLNKACKRASQMMDNTEMIDIFIQVLNKYIYLAMNKCTDLDYGKISQLIELVDEKIRDQAQSCEEPERLEEIRQFFRLSCQYIRDLAASSDEEIREAFSQISL